MTNRKTFIILTPGFAKSEADTTCLPMQQYFVRALKEACPELNIVILSFQYPYHRNPYKWFDISVIPFDGRNRGGLSKLWLRRKINSTLKKIYDANEIAGLFSFWYNECALIGKRFGDKHCLRHYCWILGQDARKENEYPRLIPPRPNELLALSDFLQNEFEKNHGVRPQFVIPPGIDARLFNSSAPERDIDLFGAGSLIPLKQHDIFLQVAMELKKQIPGVRAMIAGNGPEKEKLQILSQKLELQKNVTLAGELEYHHVLQLMQRSKVFLHPSSYEGFSGVCLEALYAGCHVISFCKPMNTEITQWHVVKNEDEMIQKAFHLLQSKTEYKTISVYSMRDAVKKILYLFEES